MLAKYKITGWCIAAFLLIAIGFCCGWSANFSPVVVPETNAASQVQPDGSLIVERRPDATAKPAMQVPKGAKVERVMQFTVQASAPDLKVTDDIEKACPPVTLDLALVRLPDQARRVVASSPDGVVIGGIDVPVESAAPVPDAPKWAAGISYNDQRKAGLWLDRDLGRLRTGVAVRQSDQGLRGEVRIGWRF